MASTKISALTTDSAPDRVADYVATYDASVVGNKKVLLSKLGGYWMNATSTTGSPSDGTTYYFAQHAGGWENVDGNSRLYIPRAGKIVKCRIVIKGGVAGTSETSTISIRLNGTTDTTVVSTVDLSTLPYTAVNSALSIAVAEDDYISVKWVAPTWVTNPTGIFFSGQIWIT